MRRLNTAVDGLELQDFGHTTLQAFLSLARKEAQFLPLMDLLEKTRQLSSSTLETGCLQSAASLMPKTASISSLTILRKLGKPSRTSPYAGSLVRVL